MVSSPTYDVALSFAGEDRETARRLATLLRAQGINVFFDEYEQADLWGKDLYVHLQHVYRDTARFCVILISAAYARKLWTRHELRQAQARAFREHEEYILPLRLDDTEMPGLNDTTGYVDARRMSPEEISLILTKKLLKAHRCETWPETPTTLSEFSILLRQGVDETCAAATLTFLQVPEPHTAESFRAACATVPKLSPALDIEVTCFDRAGVFICHPWRGVVGTTLATAWYARPGFGDWILRTTEKLEAGYLTWKDDYASDYALEREFRYERPNYQRRTLFGFQRLILRTFGALTVAIEGHEIVRLGRRELPSIGISH